MTYQLPGAIVSGPYAIMGGLVFMGAMVDGGPTPVPVVRFYLCDLDAFVPGMVAVDQFTPGAGDIDQFSPGAGALDATGCGP